MTKIGTSAQITAVKGWATSHLVLAAIAAFALGFIVHALLF